MSSPPRHPFRFPKDVRLLRSPEFRAVYETRVSARVGPLLVHALPAPESRLRIGLSVSRRVGDAVRRNRIKRLLREAFRLERASLPGGYDLVVTVQPHDPATLMEYRELLTRAAQKLDRRWTASRSQTGKPRPRNDE